MNNSEPGAHVLGVFDVVSSLIEDEAGAQGVVIAVRRYVDGHRTYEVARLNPDNELAGGLYGDHQLRATGRRESVAMFWAEPRRAREIVIVTDDHPKTKWRGLYGVIRAEVDAGKSYEVEFTNTDGRNLKSRRCDIEVSYLRSSGVRLRPEPVPRPVQTWHPGQVQNNLWPANDFEIIDELDQYL